MKVMGFLPAAIFFVISTFSLHVHADTAVVSCACEAPTCGPCEVDVGTSFYTSKCGVDNLRVKSCKKPACQAVENQPQCFAALKNQGAPAARNIASENDDSDLGRIVEVQGEAWVLRTKKSRRKDVANKGVLLYPGDEIATTANAKVQVSLNDESVLVVPPLSRVQIEELAVVKDVSRKVLLNLLKGKVRSKASEGYSKQNVFQVKTPTAVAGVRGTEFVASYSDEGEKWVTQVHTFKGKVSLSPDYEGALTQGKERLVSAGTNASFVIEAPQSEAELHQKIRQGTLSAVGSTDTKSAEELESLTTLAVLEAIARNSQRAPAAAAPEALCAQPAAAFNQCSYSCEGNPKGAKTCRTDLPGVACVRRLCRANGQWAEATRMPASEDEQCTKPEPVVRECGANYW